MALFTALWYFSVPGDPGVRLCGFHWLTGRPCPLCGLTRALFALAKGHWTEAVHFNALSPLAFAMLFALFWSGQYARVAVEGRHGRVCGLWSVSHSNLRGAMLKLNVANSFAVLSLWLPAVAAQQTAVSDVSSQLRGIAAAGKLPELRWPDFSDYREHVRNFYEPAGYTPAWIRDGRPTPQALAIIEILKQADSVVWTPKTMTPPAGRTGWPACKSPRQPATAQSSMRRSRFA